MPSTRLAIALALLGTSLAAAGAAYVSFHGDATGASGVFHVEIIGPDGALFAGRVHLANATALSALEAAAAEAQLPLTIDRYPGMGAYVRAIGPHHAHGASGWIYQALRDGEWIDGDRSAEHWTLHEGDRLRWSWTDG